MNSKGYKIIFCFENLLRDYITEKVKDIDKCFTDQALDNIKKSDIAVDPNNLLLKDFLNFLNLGQLLDIISSKNFRKSFDNGIWKHERAKLSVISIRNDIMHSRIIFEQEIEDLMDDTKLLLDGLKDRKYKIEFEKAVAEEFNSLNVCIPYVNYPLGKDFTKLVGRENDLKELTERLKHCLPITIVGMGGLGKSALVLQMVENIVTSSNPEFKRIFFMSFKDSYFDGEIRDLSKPISNYEELFLRLATLMNIDTKGISDPIKVEDKVLTEIFKEPCLLILDNLETEIIEANRRKFIDLARTFTRNYMSNSKLVITSRSGLGQIEDKYDLTILNFEDTLELLSLIAEKKVRVNDEQKEWIEKYCEGNPLQIKTLGIVLKEANVKLAEIVIQYESKIGSLGKKILNQKEAFLSFCFDNTIKTLNRSDQILFTVVCEICSQIEIFVLNYHFFDFIIDHLELTKYGVTSFEPNNFTRLTLLYSDDNNKTNHFKLNLSAMQYLTHGKELADHYNKRDLMKNTLLYSMITSTISLIKEIMHHSDKVPTINSILNNIYLRKYQETNHEVYLHLAYTVNHNLPTLIRYLENTTDILNHINLLELLPPREINELNSVNLRNQNIVISMFLIAILQNRDIHLFALKEKLESLKKFPLLDKRQELLDEQNKKKYCKVLLKLKRHNDALCFLKNNIIGDDVIEFEVYSKLAEEARKTDKPTDAQSYFQKCERILEAGAPIRIFEKCRFFLYYGKYKFSLNQEEGIKVLEKTDSIKIDNVSLLSFALESLIIRAEYYKSRNDLDKLKKVLDKVNNLSNNLLYNTLFLDKKSMFEKRIIKLSS